MPVEITVPRLGWSMDEGTFGEWLKESGEHVETGDMVFVLEGDKAAHEVESFDSGILHIPSDAPQPGDIVEVGQLIGFLLAENESPPTSLESSGVVTDETAPVNLAPDNAAAGEGGNQPAAVSARKPSRTIASPRARHKARELGIDWNGIQGSGRNGRVRERDVVACAKRSRFDSSTDSAPAGSGTHQPGSKNRRATAGRMLAAARGTAPVTLTTKVDAGSLVKFRDELKGQAVGPALPSYTDIVVKLVANALAECPELNACWYDDGIYVYDDINIGVAVDTEAGLVAPVINDVSSCSLDDVAEQSRALVEQARAGTLSQSQLQGGTFTVTSLGMFDIDYFTPIINLPQSAILGIGRIVQEPVVRGDDIVIGATMGLSLTFDHRVIDGAPAARWLQQLSQFFQQPAQHVHRI
ncbi:MAG: dihydrolipoamide acetyltransferase family protein [Planctomycetaceae bacterium]